jgi:serine/threonine protein kinase
MSRSVHAAKANSSDQPVFSRLGPQFDKHMDPAKAQSLISEQQAINSFFPYPVSLFQPPPLVQHPYPASSFQRLSRLQQLQPRLATSISSRSQQPVYMIAGGHLGLGGSESTPDALLYEHVKMLGHGGTASVEMVRDVNTGLSYARKIIRNVYDRNMQEAQRMLRNEVEIMKRLENHHHIVKVHATYIAKRELAIVLSPVADGGDLATYLQNRRDKLTDGVTLERDHVLERSFGCLASGLAYIHSQTIRHKDIKPQNILIHRGSVMYTDFGLSYDYSDTGRSTTTGFVHGLTKRYCAPEVAKSAPRNSKSDVFSLGCIYLEIVNSLYIGYIEEDILVGPFHEKLLTLDEDFWLQAAKNGQPVMGVIRALLSHDPSRRPSAQEVIGRWSAFSLLAEPPQIQYFCAKCSDANSPSNQHHIQTTIDLYENSQQEVPAGRWHDTRGANRVKYHNFSSDEPALPSIYDRPRMEEQSRTKSTDPGVSEEAIPDSSPLCCQNDNPSEIHRFLARAIAGNSHPGQDELRLYTSHTGLDIGREGLLAGGSSWITDETNSIEDSTFSSHVTPFPHQLRKLNRQGAPSSASSLPTILGNQAQGAGSTQRASLKGNIDGEPMTTLNDDYIDNRIRPVDSEELPRPGSSLQVSYFETNIAKDKILHTCRIHDCGRVYQRKNALNKHMRQRHPKQCRQYFANM